MLEAGLGLGGGNVLSSRNVLYWGEGKVRHVKLSPPSSQGTPISFPIICRGAHQRPSYPRKELLIDSYISAKDMVTVKACTPNRVRVPTWTQTLHLSATYMAGVVVGEDGKGKVHLRQGVWGPSTSGKRLHAFI